MSSFERFPIFKVFFIDRFHCYLISLSLTLTHSLFALCPISDNGAWMEKGLDGGSNGLLRGEKGATWEGGLRCVGFCTLQSIGVWW